MLQDGATGLLVDYGDVDGLATALRTLLSDAALRHAMGERGRAQAASRFRLSAVAERTWQVYEQVLEETRGGRPRHRQPRTGL
jgi:glycosyltransferase involved in cell wall biosynthesis